MSRLIQPPGGPVIEERKHKKGHTKPIPPPKFTYTKEHHFKYCMAQFQGKESLQCPDSIFQEIRQHVPAENCTLLDVKDAIRKLRYGLYYDQAPYIWSKLTGREIPRLTEAQTEQCIAAFREYQPPNIRQFAEVLVEQKLAEQN
jgi:hypothetical protein